jgi:uncharacterized protein YeaO (DUF488 family)
MRRARLAVKRVYDAPRSDDGARYLVDRFWPRAVKKKGFEDQCLVKRGCPEQ